MPFLLTALIVWSIGGFLALLCGRHGRLASILGALAVAAGSVLAMIETVGVLADGAERRFDAPWQVPLGAFRLAIDPLSAVFVVAVAVVCGLAAIYGVGYLRHDAQRKNLGVAWCFFNLLTASMVLVVTSRNALLFLVAWEIMSLVSFFLVMFEDEKEHVRQAGWTYLIASHLGTAFLLALFAMLGGHAQSLDFSRFAVAPETGGVLFLLAIVGFGTKAGFVPLHVWLPEAHPAAPSHVSAVMSGVMIKMGIYGLLRTLTFLGAPAAWWGWLLVVVGASSGILGVLFALAQHDLKRLLAYHSVENIGIIALGVGVGVLGVSYGNPTMAMLGFAGGILHVLNHALFKSLLFLGAGAVAHATGTREIDRLGGLLRRMPVTGATFLVGAAAISGLPPLNGFVSELLIYLGSFHGLLAARGMPSAAVASLLVIGSLALIGGLAAACFTKAFGVVFLGEPRSRDGEAAQEVAASLRFPMVILAAACVLIGLLGPLMPSLVGPAAAVLVPAGMPGAGSAGLALGKLALAGVCYGSLILLGGAIGLTLLRRRLLAGRPVAQTGTWDCGYVAPTARMQYTASSFAQPLVGLFHVLLRTKVQSHRPEGMFPQRAGLHTETRDLFRERMYAPLFAGFRRTALWLHGLQQGRIQLYVLYIAIVLIVLLVWKLG
jgi:formate hydrogenlyase subunit 3/multisubunit Na+/H+ antiporter MnhD subunit